MTDKLTPEEIARRKAVKESLPAAREAAKLPMCLHCGRTKENHGPDTGHEYTRGFWPQTGQHGNRKPLK